MFGTGSEALRWPTPWDEFHLPETESEAPKSGSFFLVNSLYTDHITMLEVT